MSNVPYDGSGPTVAPDTRAPDDFQRIDASPDAFGAAIGRGLQQFGAGVEQAQKFQGQVRGDDAYNTYADQANKILRGDSSKQVAGPDGTMVPDSGYFGLKGSAAVQARAGVEQQLADLRTAGRQGLSPEAALQYDAQTRRLATGNSERLAQHADQQEVVYQQGVHQGSADNSLTGISVNPLDGDSVAHHTADLINARINAVRLAGGGAEQQTAAVTLARQQATMAQVEAVAGTDPQKALEILNAKKVDAGSAYAPAVERLQGKAYLKQGNDVADAVFKGQPVPGQAQPAPPQDAAPAALTANGLPQEGPMPPARGDGGTAPTQPAAPPAAAAPTVSPAHPDFVSAQQLKAADAAADARGKKPTLSAADKAADADYQKMVDRYKASHGIPRTTGIDIPKLPDDPAGGVASPGAIQAGQPKPQQPGNAPNTPVSGAQSYPTLIVNPKTGRADTSGAPEIDRSAASPAPVAAAQPPEHNRDVSPAPVAHPSTLAIPYFAQSFENDRSHSLPAPIAGAAALPYFNKAGAAYGISGSYLARTWQIESNSGKSKGASSAGALGDFQFIPSTWAKYGNGGNRMDFGASTMAAVRLAADNKANLTRSLGREPSDAELYLAHQQGAAGAAKLLSNPNARAGDIVGNQAVSGNGGDPNMTARAFASIWLNKFNGIKPSDNAVPMFASGFGTGQPYFGGPPPAGVLPPMMPDAMVPPPPAAAQAMAPLQPQDQAVPRAMQAPAPPQIAEQPTFRDPKADAYARIEAMDVPQEVKQHAFQRLGQIYQEQDLATEQTQRMKKARSDQAYGGYTQRALNGEMGPGILRQIANDPSLLPETKWTLSNAITAESKRQGEDREAKNFGSGYARTLSAITAGPDDPSRISDPTQVLHMVHDGSLTLAGADKLIGAMRLGARSADDHAVEVARAGVIKSMHEKMSFESPEIHLRDRTGESAFNERFVPQYEAGFDKWVKAGKDPWDYVNDTKSAEALADRLRSKRSMDADRLQALDHGGEVPATMAPNPFTPDSAAGVNGQGPPASPPAAATAPARPPQPTPPSPPATNPEGWAAIAQAPPVASDGQPWPVTNWAGAVAALKANPTEANRRAFDRRFGPAGYRADDVLQRLAPKSPMGDEPMGGL